MHCAEKHLQPLSFSVLQFWMIHKAVGALQAHSKPKSPEKNENEQLFRVITVQEAKPSCVLTSRST